MKWLNLTTDKSNLFNKVQRNKKWFTYIHAQNNHETKNVHNIAFHVYAQFLIYVHIVQSGRTVFTMENGVGGPYMKSGPPGSLRGR